MGTIDFRRELTSLAIISHSINIYCIARGFFEDKINRYAPICE